MIQDVIPEVEYKRIYQDTKYVNQGTKINNE